MVNYRVGILIFARLNRSGNEILMLRTDRDCRPAIIATFFPLLRSSLSLISRRRTRQFRLPDHMRRPAQQILRNLNLKLKARQHMRPHNHCRNIARIKQPFNCHRLHLTVMVR